MGLIPKMFCALEIFAEYFAAVIVIERNILLLKHPHSSGKTFPLRDVAPNDFFTFTYAGLQM